VFVFYPRKFGTKLLK